MPEPLTAELSRAGLDSISMALESYASGCNPDLDAPKADISSRRQLLDRGALAIAGLECGTLTRADAQRLCGWSDEPAPETLRASCPCVIPPPEPTLPDTTIEETA